LEGPRPILPEEYPGLLLLVNSVFHHGHIHQALPLLFNPENYHRLWVVFEDGKPVSHLGMICKDVRLGSVATRVAAYGCVCTYPEYRGRGHASRLLQAAFAASEAEGADLVMISGGRGLYRRAGCTNLGGIQVGRLRLEGVADASLTFHRFAGDITPFARLAEGEPVRWVRSEADWQILLTQDPLGSYHWERVWASREGQPVAYAILKVWDEHHHHAGHEHHDHPRAALAEWAGERQAVLAATRYACPDRTVGCTVPWHDREMRHLAFAGQEVKAETNGTGKVLNLPRLLSRIPGLPADLACSGDRERWVLTLADESLVLEGEAPGWLVWGHPEGKTDFLPAPGPLREALEGVFPLPRLCYGLNYV